MTIQSLRINEVVLPTIESSKLSCKINNITGLEPIDPASMLLVLKQAEVLVRQLAETHYGININMSMVKNNDNNQY